MVWASVHSYFNSIAKAMELLQSYTTPAVCYHVLILSAFIFLKTITCPIFFSIIAYDINADIFGGTSTSLQHGHTQRHVLEHQHSY